MNHIKSFEDLIVWQEAHKLMLKSYKLTQLLPIDEKFNRIIQIKKSCSSTPANIAEGYGRYHYLENIQFCRQARGSLDELKNHIIAARDLKQAPIEICQELIEDCNKVRALLNGYIKATFNLKNKI
ncbi:four helix bundle protein [Patescibacteria group bacterium]|nr:four helix bundle protein [Patescibacteria group bacterium]MBU1921715.1 four helix bundle protein [Patescibacteria group bacterium]